MDLAAIDAEIEAVRAAYGAGDVALEDMTPILRDLRGKRRAAEQQLATQDVGQWVGPLQTWNDWDDLDLSQRRTLVARHLDAVVVGPRKSTGPGRYEPERLTVHWKDGTKQQVTWNAFRTIPLRDSAQGCWRIPKNAEGEWIGMTATGPHGRGSVPKDN